MRRVGNATVKIPSTVRFRDGDNAVTEVAAPKQIRNRSTPVTTRRFPSDAVAP